MPVDEVFAKSLEKGDEQIPETAPRRRKPLRLSRGKAGIEQDVFFIFMPLNKRLYSVNYAWNVIVALIPDYIDTVVFYTLSGYNTLKII